jgi:ATP-dependent exoDNAse (exonuclease V) beta subunit
MGRLLYVGCTRAKSRLHLTATLGVDVAEDDTPAWPCPPKGSPLERMWDAVGNLAAPPASAAPGTATEAGSPPPLLRFPAAWSVPLPAPGVPVVAPPEAPRDALPFDWARETARLVGVVAHRRFAQVAREGLGAWNEARVAAAAPRIRAELSGEGVDERELTRATADVVAALDAVVTDARGRWLLAPEHEDPRSEWALAGVDEGGVAHVVVDRSFVTDGVRWIVDFKTGRHEGVDVDAFLDRERERYRDQIERYARLVAALDARPIRLGLYHPLLRGWREWPHSA